MITAAEAKKISKIASEYIDARDSIWTILDTIQLWWLEKKIIWYAKKKGKIAFNYWHNIRSNVIIKLEEKGFGVLPCIAFYEISWNTELLDMIGLK